MTPIYQMVNKTESGTNCLGITFFISCVPVVFSLVISMSLAWLDYKRHPTLSSSSNTMNNSESSQVSIKITDVFRFPLSLWFVYAICITFYCTLFPFITISKVFFISKYGFEPSKAAGVSR